jgi:hypothetical protein
MDTVGPPGERSIKRAAKRKSPDVVRRSYGKHRKTCSVTNVLSRLFQSGFGCLCDFCPSMTSDARFRPVFKASRPKVLAPLFNKGTADLNRKSPDVVRRSYGKHRKTCSVTNGSSTPKLLRMYEIGIGFVWSTTDSDQCGTWLNLHRAVNFFLDVNPLLSVVLLSCCPGVSLYHITPVN